MKHLKPKKSKEEILSKFFYPSWGKTNRFYLGTSHHWNVRAFLSNVTFPNYISDPKTKSKKVFI